MKIKTIISIAIVLLIACVSVAGCVSFPQTNQSAHDIPMFTVVPTPVQTPVKSVSLTPVSHSITGVWSIALEQKDAQYVLEFSNESSFLWITNIKDADLFKKQSDTNIEYKNGDTIYGKGYIDNNQLMATYSAITDNAGNTLSEKTYEPTFIGKINYDSEKDSLVFTIDNETDNFRRIK